MSELTEQPGDGLNRPYTVGTFQHKLDKFQDFIKDITFQDVEATPEERRQMITGTRLSMYIINEHIKNYPKAADTARNTVSWACLFGSSVSPYAEGILRKTQAYKYSTILQRDLVSYTDEVQMDLFL